MSNQTIYVEMASDPIEVEFDGTTVTIDLLGLVAPGSVGTDLPKDLGTPSAGSSSYASAQDHVHQMPDAADVGADPDGTADAFMTAHLAALDPHPQYASASGFAAHVALTTSAHGGIVASTDPRLTDARTPTAHQLDSASFHTVSGLTIGHFLKATSATTFGFAAHGLTASDVGADPAGTAAAAIVSHVGLSDPHTQYQKESEKAAANGYASLDAGGKVPVAQLPAAIMEFKGAWDVVTNTPTLADGTGDQGDVYRASTAGTRDLGSGPQTWAVGDWCMYNGTIWQRSPATDAVTSVNTKTGAVVLIPSDIGAAAATHYHAGADITSGTIDGDRLPAMSTTKRGGVPATGTPTGLFLRDDATWQSVTTDLSPAVILLPTTSARNVIQPSGAAVIPLVCKAFAGQTAALFEMQDSSGNSMSRFNATGYLRIASTTGVDAATRLAINDPISSTFGAEAFITCISAARNGLVLQGYGAGVMSVPYFKILNGSGTEITRISGSGGFHVGESASFVATNRITVNSIVGSTDANAAVFFRPGGAAVKALVLQAYAAQTANLQEWQNSAGAVLGQIAADGTPSFPGAGALSCRFGASSTAAGANALAVGNSAAASGDDSVALGYTAATNSVGSSVAIGSGASIYTGGTAGAIAIGKAARAFKGVSIGFQAGKSLTGGTSAQVCIGYNAGDAATSASGLVAIGQDAAGAVTNGSGNTAVGYDAMTTVTTGDYNTALGWTCGKSSGSRNTSLGAFAQDTGGSGSDNTSIGAAANGTTGATGSNNVAIGAYALNATGSACTGSENVVIGSYSGRALAGAAASNVFLGRNAGTNASQLGAVTNSTAIGNGTYTTKSNQMRFGNDSVTEAIFGASAFVYIGDSETDGSWRLGRSGNDLVIERRESSTWVPKSTIQA